MTSGALKQLLDQRVQRDPSLVVTQEVVSVWIAEFGAHWAECEGNVVPSLMYTRLRERWHQPVLRFMTN